jgi:hypothetical protein
MADEHDPQHDPGEDILPEFICPACGYFCASTWEARPANTPDAIFYERGKVLVTLARKMPLQTVCIHPDGTSSYGEADTATIKGRVTRRMVTPEEAEEMLAAVHPTTDVPPPKRIEDLLLLALAGPIAENLHCYVSPQDYPQEFAYAYDRLLDLPDTSSLVAYDNDLRLTAIQDLIINLLNSADEDLSGALLEVLVQRHVLTPAVIQALLENPGQAYDDAAGQR